MYYKEEQTISLDKHCKRNEGYFYCQGEVLGQDL